MKKTLLLAFISIGNLCAQPTNSIVSEPGFRVTDLVTNPISILLEIWILGIIISFIGKVMGWERKKK